MFANIFFLIGSITLGALGCPAPRSPDDGQAFILDEGRVVVFACDPSFHLMGPRTVTCLDSGEWDQDFPVCTPGGVVSDEPMPVRRALFDWGQEENSTDAKGDEGSIVLSSQELQDEQRKREGSPSVIYVRRPLRPQNDKGEDYLRRLYYHNNYYYHQRQHSYQQQPQVSESQMAWILSLHPELRDQYLRDMTIRHDYTPYDPYYYDRLYLRQPLSPRGEASLDYSCNRAGEQFVVAPRVANARVLRYDRRQGPSRNHYLAAVYRCQPGYSLTDNRYSELFCSGRRWVGPRPVCLPN